MIKRRKINSSLQFKNCFRLRNYIDNIAKYINYYIFINMCKFIPMFIKTIDHWDLKTNATTRITKFANKYQDERIILGILSIIFSFIFVFLGG
ncbi:hypothetical protein MBIO_0668 [Mycoplasmopsis fermentans PG18]|uniref:Uncharacterized protein n=3 Tax=Mycoplasmopsis fermentans TaxID=2115 RepID=C4XFL1_MYCFP|nr:hypothetical protein MBIO_0668 [Mycoplasmopsis fermentans PG18]